MSIKTSTRIRSGTQRTDNYNQDTIPTSNNLLPSKPRSLLKMQMTTILTLLIGTILCAVILRSRIKNLAGRPDPEASPHDRNPNDPVSPSSSPPINPDGRTAKDSLINDLRIRHKEMICILDHVAGFQYHTWRSQPPASVSLAEGLTGLNYRLEHCWGELGDEGYYEYLRKRTKYEIWGALRRAEEWLEHIEENSVGLRFVF